MKKSILIIAVALVSMLSFNTNAQQSHLSTGMHINSGLDDPAGLIIPSQGGATATATASATADIVIPLEISKDVDLVFGKIAAGPSAGSVIIATDGSRTGNGGVTLIAAGNVNSAAQFSLIGYPEATFSIELPALITITNGGYQMNVTDFVSSLGNTSALDVNGVSTLSVGATLNVDADQQPGLYTGSFDITVAYN